MKGRMMALNLWSQPSLWPQLVSEAHCQQVLAGSEGKTEGFLGPLRLCGLAPHLSWGPMSPTRSQ